MQALILAAGRGSRMECLTKTTPKPLLKVAGKALIDYTIENLHQAKIKDIWVNTYYLADKIIAHLKHTKIKISRETKQLESGGGVINLLDVLDDFFIIVNADVLTDFDFSTLKLSKNSTSLARLILVDNPAHNSQGDFNFNGKKLTFSGIGIYHKNLFINYPKESYLQLGKIIQENLDKISFSHYQGQWLDVGTPQRLEYANIIIQ